MTKKKAIEWAKAQGVRFVFSQLDGFGKKVYIVTNDDRRNEGHLTLVWSAE